MTYYLKYRPQKLKELDLIKVQNTLQKMLSAKKIPHALLFSGPKGTGKTSAARILAKAVNCIKPKIDYEPCNKCEQCLSITDGSNLDLIEIDAASNRGIDDVRIIRDSVKLAPASAKKKVYIIDEAHMLTLEASNALLKTLEEPPSHVIFILATTNSEKIIPTICSRTTEIVFSKPTDEEVVNSLKKIVKGEKLKYQKDILSHIAHAAKGSFRDGAKLLEQIVSLRFKKEEEIVSFLLSQGENSDEILKFISERKTKEALLLIEELEKQGILASDLLDTILEKLKLSLLAKEGLGGDSLTFLTKEGLISLIELIIEAKEAMVYSPIEQLPLELALVKWGEKFNKEELKENSSSPILETEKPKVILKKESKEIKVNLKPLDEKSFSEEVWQKILAGIKPINTSIEALLKAAKPLSFDGKILTLGVYYKFHKERLEESRHLMVLEKVVAEVLHCPAKIICLLTEQPKKVLPQVVNKEVVLTEEKDDDIVKVAKEIFGS